MPVKFAFFNTRDLHSRCLAHSLSNWQWSKDVWRNWRAGSELPPVKLNVTTGPSLAYILIFSILVVSSRLLLFWFFSGCFNFLTLWRPLGFGDFREKTPKRTWLCAGISLVRYALQTW